MLILQKIRQKIIDEDYYLSIHAEEERINDNFSIEYIENAILKGHINKKLTEDYRGIRYRIDGPALNKRVMHIVCRFDEVSKILIITVYDNEE